MALDDFSLLPERFWAKVSPEPNSGCWLWTATTDWAGYGRIKVAGRMQRSHRIAYEALIGPIPFGLHIDHLCRVPNCVNPAHLEPVTSKENLRRGRRRFADRTHCMHGHEYTPENTRHRPGRGRACRTCERIKAQRLRDAKKHDAG